MSVFQAHKNDNDFHFLNKYILNASRDFFVGAYIAIAILFI